MSRQDPHAAKLRGSATRRAPPTAGGGAAHAAQLADAPLRVGTHSARNAVLCLEVTAVHSHMFLGLADGTVDAYDLERFAPAPYRIPNLWWNEEEAERRNGMPGAPSRLHVPLIIDIQTHPKDVNLLLLCYEGGAVLYSVRDKNALLAFQLRLLPGAPGPYADAPMEQIWSERACPATAIAWSPDGEQFAMGHENGCISFWSIKDEDKPLHVRTLDEIDVERPTAPEELAQRRSAGPREPIFKLAWSAFPGPGWYEAAANAWSGEAPSQDAETSQHGTVLTVMGGTPVRQNAACLHTFHLPPPPPSAMWASTTPEAQYKARVAQQQSLVPTHVAMYRTTSTVEDFMLLPRLSPYYRGTYDPYAILVLVGPDDSLPSLATQATHRGLETYSFPPKTSGSDGYTPLHLPLPLSLVGRGTVLGAKIETVPLPTYRKLVQDANGTAAGSVAPDQPMGGFATPNIYGGTLMHAAGIARMGQPRLLLTWHLDGSVRVHDASPHLLLLGTEDARRGTVLEKPFPQPLPHLTVGVRDVVLHPSAIGAPALEPLQRFPMQLQIADVVAGWHSAELAVRLTTGHVLHLAYAPAALVDPGTAISDALNSLNMDTPSANSAPLPEFTPLEATAVASAPGFKRTLPYSPSACHAPPDACAAVVHGNERHRPVRRGVWRHACRR